ncbi:MAG: 23S rRNA (uracil(1939)-C(5))-methyltransferase RlmD [Lachnospiraceae bacterium]|nr:23S rRNA (uracil(1939)-C(5))-methyltransferase RlmD [Lachnospiraceae bacterium]
MNQAPWKKNQELELRIEDLGSEGEGIGKVDGFPFFVKDTLPGDVVKVTVMKAKKNMAFARLQKIISPSPDRITPPCDVYRSCGGCQIQAMDYKRQLAFKRDKVYNCLKRIGGFEEALLDRIMQAPVGMEDPRHYRCKAQYPLGRDKEGRAIAGFYAGHTHSIIPHTDCEIGAAENKAVLEAVLEYAGEAGKGKKGNDLIYNEATGEGLLRHVLIRKSHATGGLMVCLIINGEQVPDQELLIGKLSAIPEVKSISLNTNTERTNVIMGRKTRTIWGEETIEDTLRLWEKGKLTGEEVRYRISPNSFFQVNPVQTEQLYSLALSYAELTGNETVWDLYCGLGSISLFLAQRAKKVYGVEIIPQAIEDAKKNAEDNSLLNTEFFVGKAEEVLPAWYEKNPEEQIDVIVVDPPRKGCDAACLSTMLQMAPKRIVYVSCDPATLARDLKILCEDGRYELTEVTPVDMFPQTVHVETVVLLTRQNT